MASSDDYEEIEETLVMAELQGVMEMDFLSHITQAKVLGVGTDKPLFQFNDSTFSGQYQNTMGTCMFFEEIPSDEPDANESEFGAENGQKPRPKVEYRYLTNKKLSLERIFLNKDTEASTGADSSEGVSETMDRDKTGDRQGATASGEGDTSSASDKTVST